MSPIGPPRFGSRFPEGSAPGRLVPRGCGSPPPGPASTSLPSKQPMGPVGSPRRQRPGPPRRPGSGRGGSGAGGATELLVVPGDARPVSAPLRRTPPLVGPVSQKVVAAAVGGAPGEGNVGVYDQEGPIGPGPRSLVRSLPGLEGITLDFEPPGDPGDLGDAGQPPKAAVHPPEEFGGRSDAVETGVEEGREVGAPPAGAVGRPRAAKALIQGVPGPAGRTRTGVQERQQRAGRVKGIESGRISHHGLMPGSPPRH